MAPIVLQGGALPFRNGWELAEYQTDVIFAPVDKLGTEPKFDTSYSSGVELQALAQTLGVAVNSYRNAFINRCIALSLLARISPALCTLSLALESSCFSVPTGLETFERIYNVDRSTQIQLSSRHRDFHLQHCETYRATLANPVHNLQDTEKANTIRI
ncbi:hypothetical protein M427DRAFT_409593 [Gonapodya prolifera JEL478]|uniref:Uncharacterized protein n=1 Tax=Gonapodya prolifera (strain JEL478) TaxID=1344416 RepID=A0A139A617_GONPJ|nr:hypothetical protein M427DRAFT_409593 [Gonapodya prolifera JEL478]|eukprot:KXS12242.1 hypothetical protein M427DRAFT_409593 [Gonapodya prolifera JEL478]